MPFEGLYCLQNEQNSIGAELTEYSSLRIKGIALFWKAFQFNVNKRIMAFVLGTGILCILFSTSVFLSRNMNGQNCFKRAHLTHNVHCKLER